VLICCFCLRTRLILTGLNIRWANLKRALPDLMPKCETLQEAVYTHFDVYTHFEECNS
jgi:hypothetical protein